MQEEENRSHVRSLEASARQSQDTSSSRRPIKDDVWSRISEVRATNDDLRSRSSHHTAATACDSTISDFSAEPSAHVSASEPSAHVSASEPSAHVSAAEPSAHVSAAEPSAHASADQAASHGDAETQTKARRWWRAPCYYRQGEQGDNAVHTQQVWHELTRLPEGHGEGLLIDPGAYDNLQGSEWALRQEKDSTAAGCGPGQELEYSQL
eukprot:1092308-Amphidinium_carterae.2